MKEMQGFLVKSETFGSANCNFYRGENDEIYMTREQIGRALGYSEPTQAIVNIQQRNADRFSDKATTLILRGVDGRRRVHTVYTAKGIMEICRHSNQPKANDFMDWVWDVIDTIRKTGAYLLPAGAGVILNAGSFFGDLVAAPRRRGGDPLTRTTALQAQICSPQARG